MPRTRRMRRRAALSALRMMAAGTVLAQAVAMPDLSGSWQLNRDASDDPARVMQEARAESGGSGGGSGFGGGGRHGHGGGGGSSGGGGGWGRGNRSSSGDGSSSSDGGSFAALQTLTLVYKEPMLTITDAAGRERVVYTDGRKTEEERSHGGTTAVVASWKDGHLEIVASPENGGKITETFAMTADHKQLTVTTKMEGGRRGSPITIRRVYDAATPGQPETAPGQKTRPPAPPPDTPEDDQSV